MAKYIVYYSREMYGYKEFEAKDDKEAEDKIEDMEMNGNFPKDFDSVKDEGWVFVDYDKEQGVM